MEEVDELKLQIQLLEKKIDSLYAFVGGIKSFNSSFGNNEILLLLIKNVCKTLDIKDFCLMVWDKDQQVLKNLIINCQRHKDKKVVDITLKTGEGISGKTFEKGQYIFIQNGSMQNKFKHHEGCCCLPNAPILSLPLCCNRLIGVLNIHKSNILIEEMGLFSLLAEQIAIAINRTTVYGKLKESN